MTNFDVKSAERIESAREHMDAAGARMEEAAQQMGEAGEDAKMAAAHLIAAGLNVAFATGYAVKGTVHAVEGVSHGVAGTALHAAGGAVWVEQQAQSGASRSMTASAKGLAGLADRWSDRIGDGVTVTAKDLEPRGGDLASAQLFEMGRAQYQAAGEDFGRSWNAFSESIKHAAAAPVNVAFAAGYTAMALADISEALAHSTVAGAEVIAAQLDYIAALLIQVDENVEQALRDVLIWAAEASAAAGRALATAKDGTVEIEVIREAMQDFSFADLLNSESMRGIREKLLELPAAKKLLENEGSVTPIQ